MWLSEHQYKINETHTGNVSYFTEDYTYTNEHMGDRWHDYSNYIRLLIFRWTIYFPTLNYQQVLSLSFEKIP